MSSCIHCQQDVPNQVKYCPECGQLQQPVEVLCRDCGTRNESGTKFCVACGSAFPSIDSNATPEVASENVSKSVENKPSQPLTPEEKRKQRLERAKELAENLKKQTTPIAQPITQTYEPEVHQDDIASSFAEMVSKLKPETHPEVLDDTLRSINDCIQKILDTNISRIKDKTSDPKYIQYIKDRYSAKSIFVDSPFIIPEVNT